MTERLANEYTNSVPREIKVAESPPAIKKSSDLDKQTTDSTKAIATTIKTTTIPVSNKPKPDIISENGKNVPDPKIIKNTNSQSAEVPGDSTGGVHKNTVTDANRK